MVKSTEFRCKLCYGRVSGLRELVTKFPLGQPFEWQWERYPDRALSHGHG
jgi:hypothetical protein